MTKTDTPTSIMRSAKSFFSGTMASRISGMIRDITMAFAFGTEANVAAFFMAFRFAHLFRRLFGEGALQTAFIPFFEKMRQQNDVAASHFFIDLYASLNLFLCAIIAAIMGIGSIFLTFGQLSPANQEILFYSILMQPSLLFICLYGLNAALLQCHKHYFLPSSAPIAFNAIWILAALIFQNAPPSQAMTCLSASIVAACFFQWIATVPKTWQLIVSPIKKDSWRGVHLYSSEVKKLCSPLLLGIVGVAASQINSAFDVLFARYASPQGPAYLWYAIRLQQLPLALFGIAIASALLPALSRTAKKENSFEFGNLLLSAIYQALTFLIPTSAILFLWGGYSIDMLFGHGDFNAYSTIQTTYCLWGYGIGLIPMALVLLLAPAFYASHRYSTPTIASTVAMAVNIALNAIFAFGMGWGTAAIAFATGLSAWVNFFLLAWGLKNSKFQIGIFRYFSKISGIAASTLFATFAAAGVESYLFGRCQAWAFISGEFASFPSFQEKFVASFIPFLIFFGCWKIGNTFLKK